MNRSSLCTAVVLGTVVGFSGALDVHAVEDGGFLSGSTERPAASESSIVPENGMDSRRAGVSVGDVSGMGFFDSRSFDWSAGVGMDMRSDKCYGTVIVVR